MYTGHHKNKICTVLHNPEYAPAAVPQRLRRGLPRAAAARWRWRRASRQGQRLGGQAAGWHYGQGAAERAVDDAPVGPSVVPAGDPRMGLRLWSRRAKQCANALQFSSGAFAPNHCMAAQGTRLTRSATQARQAPWWQGNSSQPPLSSTATPSKHMLHSWRLPHASSPAAAGRTARHKGQMRDSIG